MNRRKLLATTGAVASLTVCAGIVAGVPGCTAAPAAEPISPGLAFTIEQHSSALAELTRSCLVYSACEDAARKLRTPETVAAMEAAEAVTDIDGERERETRMRFLSEPVATMTDVRAKAQYIAANAPALDYDEQMTALVMSMGDATDSLSAVSIEPDPFVERMRAYANEIAAYNADPNPSDDDVEPSGPLLAELESGTLKIGSIAGAVMALRQVVAIDATRDVEAQALIAETLTFLEGRA